MLWILLAAQIGLASAPANGIAVVNLQRALTESSTGRALIAKVSALRDEKAQALAERQRALDAEITRGTAASTIERLRVELQRASEDADAEVADLVRSVQDDFGKRLRPILQQILEEDHLGLIFEVPNPVVVWAHPTLDVTAKAITLLDQPPPEKK